MTFTAAAVSAAAAAAAAVVVVVVAEALSTFAISASIVVAFVCCF